MPTPRKPAYPKLLASGKLAEWKASGKYPSWVTSKILRAMERDAGYVHKTRPGQWMLADTLKAVPRPKRLEFLLAQIRLNSHVLISLAELLERRRAFDQMKDEYYPIWYLITCYCCKRLAIVRHHVIPIKHGGSNKNANIVPLCGWCHAKVHPHLLEE